MKKLLTSFLILILYSCTQAQEFTIYPNQLIYDEHTMNPLGVIIDSLNLKFKACDLSHPYYSLPQGSGTYISVDSSDIEKAKEAILKNVTLQEFEQRFPKSKIKKGLYILRVDYVSYNKQKVTEIISPSKEEKYNLQLPYEDVHITNTGWVMSEQQDMLEAFFIHNLASSPLPHQYARLVQYVDCMIDTTAHIYLDQADESYRGDEVPKHSNASKFIHWANDFPNKPAFPDYNYSSRSKKQQKIEAEAYQKYERDYRTWDSLRLVDLDDRIRKNESWRTTLEEACNDAVEKGYSSDELEQYAARYLSKELALQLKRSRRVVGGCSMDNRPRVHAMNICILAAQTAKWDIFLRSHLNIMNDRFDRVSDGSWAWGERKTYFKELEALNIHAADLLLGTCLRVDNVSDNHYFGSIDRIGRALSETSQADSVETQMLTMITDPSLDLYNRFLIAYLYRAYTSFLPKEKAKKEKELKLKEAVKTFPNDLQYIAD